MNKKNSNLAQISQLEDFHGGKALQDFEEKSALVAMFE